MAREGSRFEQARQPVRRGDREYAERRDDGVIDDGRAHGAPDLVGLDGDLPAAQQTHDGAGDRRRRPGRVVLEAHDGAGQDQQRYADAEQRRQAEPPQLARRRLGIGHSAPDTDSGHDDAGDVDQSDWVLHRVDGLGALPKSCRDHHPETLINRADQARLACPVL